MHRGKKIVKISIYGIIVNFALVAFKALVGFLSNSISIILDAVNNFSDALSSIITIIGVKLSEKRPDKKHPFGHGRIEYFSAILISVAVFVAGAVALKESIEKIINPIEADYSIAALVIILITVFVKLFFGRYVKKKGQELNSGSLVASGVDAISDAFLSFSVFVGAVMSFLWHISLEGYLGMFISVMIIKTAIEIMKKGIDDVVGTRADKKIVQKLKKLIINEKDILSVHDITIHNYGPSKMIASAHIRVDDNIKARDIHRLTRRVGIKVFEETGIILTLGIYASNDDDEYKSIKSYLDGILKQYKTLKEMHGFYVDEKTKTISFDLVFDFNETKPEKIIKEILLSLETKYPDYKFSIILDADVSD